MNPIRRYAIHGSPVELECGVDVIDRQLQHLLSPFAESSLPEGFHPVSGVVRPYVESEVIRRMPPRATLLDLHRDLAELYQDGERFWIVDDRWGLAEINLLRGEFRSWIIESAISDPARAAEMSVLWPLAQVLRARGLHLVPAASLAADGRGLLVLSSFGIERELIALVRDGFQVIGQRWTAIRDESDSISLLAMPGRIPVPPTPQLRQQTTYKPAARSIDLSTMNDHAAAVHAFATHVLIVEPGRHASAVIKNLQPAVAAPTLRHRWPIVELHRKATPMPARLSDHTTVARVQLARDPQDFLLALNQYLARESNPAPSPRPKITIFPEAIAPLARAG